MSPFFQKSKKLARLKAARKQMPKASRAFFVTLMVAVALQLQGQLLQSTAANASSGLSSVTAGF